jgi:hypothetical protein
MTQFDILFPTPTSNIDTAFLLRTTRSNDFLPIATRSNCFEDCLDLQLFV